MERLRRRIEHFRQHHNSCESRYESASLERLEQERQQTLALHQRCLQAKAKKSSKHRQPPASSDSPGQRQAPNAGGTSDAADGGAAELNRSSTLIALQETVKRKLVGTGSPLARDQTNGFPPSKKACLDPGGKNGPQSDSKIGVVLNSNGSCGPGGEAAEGEGELDHRKEMKQEPDDILPIMPPVGGANNSLFPDLNLNLNEQEWTELMEELNRSVAYEDIQDIFNDGFEDRKDPPELVPPQETAVGESLVGGAHGLPQLDLGLVKAEFPPASAAFEPDSKTRAPHLCSAPSGPPAHSSSSPITSSSGPPPAAPPVAQAPPPRPHHLLPAAVAKDLSPAQQLQQLAAQQQRGQSRHGPLQHKPPLPGSKFHPLGPRAPPPPWPQVPTQSQNPRGGAYGLDKPSSPSLFSQEFPPKQMLGPNPPAKCSPKAAVSTFLPRSGVMGAAHPAGGQAPTLNYSNTKPLTHFEAAPAPLRPPITQNKAALLNLIRQQQMKQKNLNYRPLQDQNSFPEPPHGPVPPNTLTSTPSNSMPVQPGAMAANHSNSVFMSNQAEALKQQQQQQFLQRQQMLAEQEKQRQQDQQLQRHLTRPPPQYQDQLGPPANHGSFSQPPVNQFTGPAQPSVAAMGGSGSGAQRMFPQNQTMMGLNLPPVSQTDMNLPSCGSGVDVQQVLYNNMNHHQQVPLQRQILPSMSAPYRHGPMSQQQQQHPKTQSSAGMMKPPQQQQMSSSTSNRLPIQGTSSWQQPPSSAAAAPPPPFPPSTFHMQPRLSKMPTGAPGFSGGPAGRPVDGMNPGQQMVQPAMAGQQRVLPGSMNVSLSSQQQAPPSNHALPEMAPFAHTAGGVRPGLPCNQGYQVTRAANQQQVSFGYNVASGSFAPETDLVDSLLKGQSTEWIAELDELLASQH